MSERQPARSELSFPTVSVIIITWCRPDHVRTCLQHLAAVTPPPNEVLVVDASPDGRTSAVIDAFPGVRRLAFPGGAGHMTSSRNAGLLHVSGAIIAFIDDDANVRPGWLRGVLEAFAEPTVGAVAGRTCNGNDGEESEGIDEIGRMLPTGRLTGNFAADPGTVIDVDHGIGANMAFRREVLSRLGGFRDDFGGVGGVREDTDIFLRVKALGYRTAFAPDASVDHVGAPHMRGRRFDYRYSFWLRRNHALLLSRNYGIGITKSRTWFTTELGRVAKDGHPQWSRRYVRCLVGWAAVLAGFAASLRKAGLASTEPERRDFVGQRVTQALRDSG